MLKRASPARARQDEDVAISVVGVRAESSQSGQTGP